MTDTTPSEQPSVEPKESSRPVTRTPAQLEALQKARVKAAEVRAKNTELLSDEGPTLGQLLEGTKYEGPQEVSLMPLRS